METSPESINREEGLRLMKAGQFAEAIEVLGQLVEQEPEDPELQGYLGIAYFQKGDKLHAIRHLEESVNIQETPRMYYNLGLVYEAAYREDEAIRQYKMALAIDSGYGPAQKALDKLQQTFEAAHPAPEPEEQTVEMQAQQGAEPTIGAAPVQTAAPQQPPKPTGPPDPLLLQIEKQKKMMEHQATLRKAGLSYGLACGAVMTPLTYFATAMAGTFIGLGLLLIPKWAANGAGLFGLVMLLMVIGAIFGGGVGLYIAHTCGGESAGTKAGAALGFIIGTIIGLISGAGAACVVVGIVFLLIGLASGNLIGRLVSNSLGWD